MDESVKNDSKQIMLVRQAKDGKIKAVTDVDRDGNIKTTEPTPENIGNLFSVNMQDSLLEAFFKKLMQEVQNPSYSGVFILTERALNQLIKIDLDTDILEKYRVDPQAILESKQEQPVEFQPMDVTKIDMGDLNRKGIRWEDMEPHLKAMSYGHKSPGLVDMNPELESGGLRVSTKGRLKLEEQPDGSLRVIPFYKQEQPNLDAPLYNVLLDDETKTNLMNTGNAGKFIELELTPGKQEPCYVSIDKYTNGLEVLPMNEMGEVTQLKDVNLTQGQQIDFKAGRKVLVEGMTSRNGFKFDAYIQINASDRKIDFLYDGLDRNRYKQENKVIRHEKQQLDQVTGKTQSQENSQPKINIPKTIKNAKVPEDAYKQWSAAVEDPALQKDVKAFYIKGMSNDGEKEPFNAWVKPNFEEGRMRFYKWNPDRAQKQGTSVTPKNETQKQVAANAETKTNEAAKSVKASLTQAQQQHRQSTARGPKL